MRELSPIRILLMADSHLGFDLPMKPRVERRLRGHDFLANHGRALRPALRGEVDLVVHGGDLFHRSRVPPSLVYQAFQPLLEVADRGTPVFLVPGNHERSRIPHERFGIHPNIHIFREPTTFQLRVRETRIALSGFPYHRKGIREGFPEILHATGWRQEETDLRLLCMHHCVEGATVGPSDFTFRYAPNVIRASDLPGEFAAVLSGHIHRRQVLNLDLQGRGMDAPAYYPGSVERTAFAEAGEEKGFLILDAVGGAMGGQILAHEFRGLPARSMEVVHLDPPGGPGGSWAPDLLDLRLRERLAAVPRDAVLQVRVRGHLPQSERAAISAANLRKIFPGEMNIQLLFEEDRVREKAGRERGNTRRTRHGERWAHSSKIQHHLAL